MRKLFLLLSVLTLLSCENQNKDILKLTFLQLNDVYEISALENGKVGGLARVENLHQQLIKENPNTLLFMAGDFLNPSLIGTLKQNGERIKGKQMIDVMNAMNFDLVAFGNHEFDLKQKTLQKRLNESNFQWISTNAMAKDKQGKITQFYVEKNQIKKAIPRTITFSFKADNDSIVKVGFIAPCINSNPKEYVDYGDFYEDSKNAFNKLKNKTNFVIGLTHLQQNQDEMLAKMLPEIPLLMGGHEHTNRLIPIENCNIAKADANAKTVYVHRLEYHTITKKLTITSELIPINEQTGEDEKVATIVKKWEDLMTVKIKDVLDKPTEIIYNAITPLDGRDTPTRSTQTNLGKIIAKSMAFSYDNKVDCALVNGGSIRIDDQLTGNITGVDIFRVLPYGGKILKVKLRGKHLEKVLQYGKLKAGSGAYLQRYNAVQKNKKWLVNNKLIEQNKIYTVAFSDYLLKGYDISFLNEKNKDIISIYTPTKEDLNFDIRKSVIAYMKTIK
ncbi:MAG: bifunctional metallophosphatase/5'-nucleotidase [Flavobacteriaceae bacterium]